MVNHTLTLFRLALINKTNEEQTLYVNTIMQNIHKIDFNFDNPCIDMLQTMGSCDLIYATCQIYRTYLQNGFDILDKEIEDDEIVRLNPDESDIDIDI